MLLGRLAVLDLSALESVAFGISSDSDVLAFPVVLEGLVVPVLAMLGSSSSSINVLVVLVSGFVSVLSMRSMPSEMGTTSASVQLTAARSQMLHAGHISCTLLRASVHACFERRNLWAAAKRMRNSQEAATPSYLQISLHAPASLEALAVEEACAETFPEWVADVLVVNVVVAVAVVVVATGQPIAVCKQHQAFFATVQAVCQRPTSSSQSYGLLVLMVRVDLEVVVVAVFFVFADDVADNVVAVSSAPADDLVVSGPTVVVASSRHATA